MAAVGNRDVVRLPRRKRVLARIGVCRGDDDPLAKLDLELRTIDQATRALAERKKTVLSEYRALLRNLAGKGVLLLMLICVVTVPPKRHCRSARSSPAMGSIARPAARARGGRLGVAGSRGQ
jgi:hypothetical protein